MKILNGNKVIVVNILLTIATISGAKILIIFPRGVEQGLFSDIRVSSVRVECTTSATFRVESKNENGSKRPLLS